MSKRKQIMIVVSIFAVMIIGLAYLNIYLYKIDQAREKERIAYEDTAEETEAKDEIIVMRVPEIVGDSDQKNGEADGDGKDKESKDPQVDPTYPEGMQQPAQVVPKPSEPPASDNVVVTSPVITNTPVKANTAPVTVPTEKPKVPQGGGIGSDGKLYDMNGNVLVVEGNPNAPADEVNGSDLEGQFEMGQGDKF